jgi:hypothetical protein
VAGEAGDFPDGYAAVGHEADEGVLQLARCPRAVDADDSQCCAESRRTLAASSCLPSRMANTGPVFQPSPCRRPASASAAKPGRRSERRRYQATFQLRSPIGATTSIRGQNVVGSPEPLSSGGLGGAALQEGGLWASGYVQPVVDKAGGQRAVSHGGPHPFQRVCANVAGGEDAGLAGLQRVGAAA